MDFQSCKEKVLSRFAEVSDSITALEVLEALLNYEEKSGAFKKWFPALVEQNEKQAIQDVLEISVEALIDETQRLLNSFEAHLHLKTKEDWLDANDLVSDLKLAHQRILSYEMKRCS